MANRCKRGQYFDKNLKMCIEPPFHVNVWEERDRASVSILDANDEYVMTWWDEDVHDMIEMGFFTQGRRFEDSVIAYASEMGMIKE